MEKTIILLSGGIDSFVSSIVLGDFDRDLSALFIDYGQSAARAEEQAAKKVANYLAAEFMIIRLAGGPDFGVGEVSCRNLFLLSTAALAIGNDGYEIAIGIHAGTPYFDCNEEFFETARDLIRRSTNDTLTVLAPLLNWKKPQILKYAEDQGIPLSITYSCEEGSVPPCGKCLSCKDREFLNC